MAWEMAWTHTLSSPVRTRYAIRGRDVPGRTWARTWAETIMGGKCGAGRTSTFSIGRAQEQLCALLAKDLQMALPRHRDAR